MVKTNASIDELIERILQTNTIIMKLRYLIGYVLVATLFFAACNSQKGLTVKGNIDNASDVSIYFDKKDFNNSITSLEKTDIGNKGNFKFHFPEGITPGIYRVRMGVKSVDLVLDGTEKSINIGGDLQNLQKYDYVIEGAPLAESYRSTMKDLVEQKIAQNDFNNVLDQLDPLVSMALANSLFSQNTQTLPLQKNICERLAEKYPGVQCVKDYEAMVQNLETTAKQQAQSSKKTYNVNVGDDAPEIALPDPNGKMRKLSDLEGQIVLVDFWASWCGPCRKANPGVVETYKKYKDQGFTVFSVSLDGVDQRTKKRLNNDSAKIDKSIASSKQRWIDAIKKDNLLWKHHVSDLAKWDSKAGKTYGVRSIPTTFLIDREGKIAALNPRHHAIETELKKLL